MGAVTTSDRALGFFLDALKLLQRAAQIPGLAIPSHLQECVVGHFPCHNSLFHSLATQMPRLMLSAVTYVNMGDICKGIICQLLLSRTYSINLGAPGLHETFPVFLCFGEPMFTPSLLRRHLEGDARMALWDELAVKGGFGVSFGDSDHSLPNSQSAYFGTANGIGIDRSRRDLYRSRICVDGRHGGGLESALKRNFNQKSGRTSALLVLNSPLPDLCCQYHHTVCRGSMIGRSSVTRTIPEVRQFLVVQYMRLCGPNT